MLWLLYHPFELAFRIWSYTVYVLLDYVEYLADRVTGDYELHRRTEYKPDQCPHEVPRTPTRATAIFDSEVQEIPSSPGTPSRRVKRIKVVLDINVSPTGSRIVTVSTDNSVLPADSPPSCLKTIVIRLVRTFSAVVKLTKRLLIIVHNILVPHAKIHPLGPPKENRVYKSPTRRVPGYRRIFGLFGLELTSSRCIISVQPLGDPEKKADSPPITTIQTPRNQVKRKLSESDASSPFSGLPSEHSFQHGSDSPKSVISNINNLNDSIHTEPSEHDDNEVPQNSP